MKRTWSHTILAASFLIASVAAGQAAPRSPASLSGEWVLTTVVFGNERSERLDLKVGKGKVTGSVYRRGKRVPLAGKIEGAEIQFVIQQEKTRSSYTGRIVEGGLSGKVTVTGGDTWGEEPPADWRARPAASERDRPSAPRAGRWISSRSSSTACSRARSNRSSPSGRATRSAPGPSTPAAWMSTGRRGSSAGTPRPRRFRTVEGAMPGDVLVVRIRKLRLNRADRDQRRRPRGQGPDLGLRHGAQGQQLQRRGLEASMPRRAWRRSPKPTAHLKDLAVPVRPMLGCVGVAPGFGSAPIRTGDSGRIGGNMDFAEIREGATHLFAGLAAGCPSVRGRRPRAPGGRRIERKRPRDIARRRNHGGPCSGRRASPARASKTTSS